MKHIVLYRRFSNQPQAEAYCRQVGQFIEFYSRFSEFLFERMSAREEEELKGQLTVIEMKK